MSEIPPVFNAIARHVRERVFDHPLNVIGEGRRLHLHSGIPILAALVELAGKNLITRGVAEVHDSNRAMEALLSPELDLASGFFKHFATQLRSFRAALGEEWIELDPQIQYRIESEAVPRSRKFHLRVRVRDEEGELFTEKRPAGNLRALRSTSTRRPIPRLLPAPPAEWVGRESELRRLRDFITSNAERLAVVRGPAGSGKTGLVKKLCSDLAPMGRLTDSLGGLAYFPCPEFSHAPFQELAEALGDTCGDVRRVSAIVNSGRSFAAQASDLLLELQRASPVIVILDDLHALLRRGELRDHGQLAVFILLVATTISPVRLIVGVQDAFVLPQDVPHSRIELDPLSVEDAEDYLRRTLPPDRLVGGDAAALRVVAERERVSPMHLRSVVSFLGGQATYSLADLAGENALAMRAFEAHPERHRLIDRFVDQIRRLATEHQRLLRELAVIDRPLRVEALQEMGVLTDRAILNAISPLLERSEGRIHLHSTVRDAAIAGSLDIPADDQRVHANAARYFASQPIPTTGAVLADTATLQYAMEHFIRADEPRSALQVATTLDAEHLRPAGQWESIVNHRRAVQPLLHQSNDQLQNLSELGIPLARIGLPRESVRTLLRARGIARRVRTTRPSSRYAPNVSRDRLAAALDAEVRALNNLGVAYTNMRFMTLACRAYERAVDVGEQQLRIASTTGLQERVARRYRNLSDACHQNGDLARAKACVLRARELSAPADPAAEGSYRAKMGVIHLKEGFVWEARADLEHAIDVSSATGSKPDARLHATRLGSLAEVWLHARMHHLAHTAVDEAIAVFQRLDTAGHLIAMIERKAEIAQDSGDLATAGTLYERARNMVREKRDYRGAVRQALLLAEIASPDAPDALNEAMLLCRWYLRFNPTMYTALHAMGVALLALGDVRAAWAMYDRSLAIVSAPGVIEEARRPLRWLDRAGVNRDEVRECDARLASFISRSASSSEMADRT